MLEDNSEEEKNIFWKDHYEGDASGGIFIRAYALSQFIKKVEEEKGTVVGIRFEGNNAELIVKKQ